MTVACGNLFDRDHLEIKQVIRWYDEALVSVYRDLDAKPLGGLVSEREMVRIDMMLLKFRSEKKVMESELGEIRFVKIDVKDEANAEVETLEKWRYRYIRRGSDELVPWTESDYKMRYIMVRQNGQWIVGLSEFME